MNVIKLWKQAAQAMVDGNTGDALYLSRMAINAETDIDIIKSRLHLIQFDPKHLLETIG